MSLKKNLLVLAASLAGCLATPKEPAYDNLLNPNQSKNELEVIVGSDFRDNHKADILYAHRKKNQSIEVTSSFYNTKEGVDDEITSSGVLLATDISLLPKFRTTDTITIGVNPALQLQDQTIKSSEYTSEIEDGLHASIDLKLESGSATEKSKERKKSLSLRYFYYDETEDITYGPIEDTLHHHGSGAQLDYSVLFGDYNKLKFKVLGVRYASDFQEEYFAGVSLVGSRSDEILSYSISAFYNRLEEKKSCTFQGGAIYSFTKSGFGLNAICDSSQLWNLSAIFTSKPHKSFKFERTINKALAVGFEQEYLERPERTLPEKQLELEKQRTIRNLERDLKQGVYLIIGAKQKYNKEWEANGRLGILLGEGKPTIGLTFNSFLERSLPHIKSQITPDITHTWGNWDNNTAGLYVNHTETTTGPVTKVGVSYRKTW